MPNKKINFIHPKNKSDKSSQSKRQLAAIMFTDIAGFTALTAKDETRAIELLSIQKKFFLQL